MHMYEFKFKILLHPIGSRKRNQYQSAYVGTSHISLLVIHVFVADCVCQYAS